MTNDKTNDKTNDPQQPDGSPSSAATRELPAATVEQAGGAPQDVPRAATAKSWTAAPAVAPAGPSTAVMSSVATVSQPERVRGPNAVAALLGLACVVVAVLAIARETSGFTVDWGSFGPGAVIAAGGVLLLLGLVGLVRRKD